MRYPTMQGQRRYRLTVPRLAGGMNLRDAPHLIDDGQVCDARNLWWKNGALRTRPGLRAGAASPYPESVAYMAADTVADTRAGVKIPGRLGYVARASGDGYTLHPFVTAADGTTTAVGRPVRSPEPHALAFFRGDAAGQDEAMRLLLLTADGEVYGRPVLNTGSWLSMRDDLYAPLLLVGGRGTAQKGGDPQGVTFEGRNLLNPEFRARYSADGNQPYYTLPLRALDEEELFIRVFSPSGGTETRYSIPADAVQSSLKEGVRANVDRTAGVVWFSDAAGAAKAHTAGTIEILASKTDPSHRPLIGGMRLCLWYGGERGGATGGTRLFVAGNPAHPNRLHWSDVNNPLYFPENNYAYIGDAGQAITALARQDSRLIVFKEREIYRIVYEAGNAMDAQDVASGAVTDVTAAAAYFPVCQISPAVGCDAPGSIQLCDNQLIWLSGGRVYTLTGDSAFSESNVREIADTIEPRLRTYPQAALQGALAGDYDRHYLLLITDQLFVYDYMDKAQPWMQWSLPLTADTLLTWDTAAVISQAQTAEGAATRSAYTFDPHIGTDDGPDGGRQAIGYLLRTKSYDGGSRNGAKRLSGHISACRRAGHT